MTKAVGNEQRVVGYIRVSTDDQALGPEAQRAAMERWCAAHGAELVAVHEEHLTGTAKRGAEAALSRRPALGAALAALAEHGAGVLLAAKRDRLARDPILGAMIERLAGRSGARVVSAAGEGTDDDDPSAILMRRMVDAFAEYEAALISARTVAALAVKKARGERTGSVPYGWELDEDGVHLLPVEQEQNAIRLARELRRSGLSLRKVAAELARRGFKARNSRLFAATQIKRLLVAEVA